MALRLHDGVWIAVAVWCALSVLLSSATQNLAQRVTAAPTALAISPVAVPTAAQLDWLDLEVSSMITWNLQTLCSHANNSEGIAVSKQPCQVASAGYVPTPEAAARWNPMRLSTDEWANVSASFGAKYIVLVADHMTGWTLWNTKYHNFSIANSKYRGGGQDIVSDLLVSCKKYGLKLGVFYSVHFNWFLGVDGFKVGHPPLGPRSYSQQQYLDIAKGQIGELLGLFGEDGAFELWFDGGIDPVYSVGIAEEVGIKTEGTRTICHGCFTTPGGPVRWMGNEEGVQSLPSWGPVTDDTTGWSLHGNATGTVFNPPVSDTVLSEHYWFWQHDDKDHIKSTKALVHNYLTSVGRASNLILNIAPDQTGAIPSLDIKSYATFGEAIRCLFSKPAPVQPAIGPVSNMNVLTGVMEPVWKFASPLAWDSSANMSLVLREELKDGQLIGNFSLECLYLHGESPSTLNDDTWTSCKLLSMTGVIPSTPLAAGIGHKRIFMIGADSNKEAVTSKLAGIRVVVASHYATGMQSPSLRDMALYDWSGSIETCV